MPYMYETCYDSRMEKIDTAAVREELRQALSRPVDEKHEIAVFGAGDSARRWLTSPSLGGCPPEDLNIRCFIDDTPKKQGTLFFGKPVITLQEAHEQCKSCSIVVCSDMPSNRRTMLSLLRQDPFEDAEVWLHSEYEFCSQSDKILAVFDMLEDAFSKATYANIVLYRMGKCPLDQAYVLPMEDQYFGIPKFKDISPKEIVVDCGAYTGDTLERFVDKHNGNFHKYFAFEPDGRNFRALSIRAERLKREWAIPEDAIQLIQCGVGEKDYQVSKVDTAEGENNTGSYFALTNRPEVADGGIPVCSIDHYFAHQPITMLKADIEGYEERMLDGAANVIKRDRPKLAVCIYHQLGDLYNIPLRVKQLCPEYRLYVRQHFCTWWETVLYAYI